METEVASWPRSALAIIPLPTVNGEMARSVFTGSICSISGSYFVAQKLLWSLDPSKIIDLGCASS